MIVVTPCTEDCTYITYFILMISLLLPYRSSFLFGGIPGQNGTFLLLHLLAAEVHIPL